jgi:hypothetical protein
MFFRTCLVLLFLLSSHVPFAATTHSVSISESAGGPQPSAFPSHTQLSAEAPTYTVRGTIVNSVTGEAIPGALVQLYSESQRSLLTNSDGKFLFERVPAGQVNVTAQKPGYFAPNLLPASVPRPPPTVTVGPDAPSAVLKLIPEGLIYGRISDDNGEPLEDFPVRLLSERVVNGKKTQREWREATTSEDGEFRFADLTPDVYFLFAGPSPQPEPIAAKLSLQGYPAVFYPGVPDLSSANPIEIIPGKRVEVHLALAPQPFYRVSGTVSGYPPGGVLNLQVFNAAGQPIGMNSAFEPDKGTFHTQFIPAGPCTITARAQDSKSQQTFSASRSLNVNSDLSGVHLTLLPGITIPINVRVEATHADESNESNARVVGFSRRAIAIAGAAADEQQQEVVPAQVTLSSTNGGVPQMQYGSSVAGSPARRFLALQSVEAGTYTVQISLSGTYYVQSANSGSVDLLRNDLTITPGAPVQPIDIVLRDDFALLSGAVRADGRNAPSLILLIPETSGTEPRFQPTNPDGSFNIEYLAPGNYKILAIDSADNFEYTKPDALQKYLVYARDVTLGPHQSAKIDLDVVRPGD